jgi:hypothetical protein
MKHFSIAAVPSFPGLRRFPQGRGFKQWTGDDSKALMKVCTHCLPTSLVAKSIHQVYLPAIVGHVPPLMVQALSAFMDFCYTVRKNNFDELNLDAIDSNVARFHAYRIVFEDVGVRNHFSLPRQHSVIHFRLLIQMFGAPNGLCSSITESKHIKAVKEPYRRSSHFEALGQMLVTNQRMDKLAAYRVSLTARRMLDGPCLAPGVIPVLLLLPLPGHDLDDGAVDAPRVLASVSLAKTRGKLIFLLI